MLLKIKKSVAKIKCSPYCSWKELWDIRNIRRCTWRRRTVRPSPHTSWLTHSRHNNHGPPFPPPPPLFWPCAARPIPPLLVWVAKRGKGEWDSVAGQVGHCDLPTKSRQRKVITMQCCGSSLHWWSSESLFLSSMLIRNRIRLFTLMRIRIRFLIKVMSSFWACTVLNFDFDADPDPTLNFDADPDPAFPSDSDPASQNDADSHTIRMCGNVIVFGWQHLNNIRVLALPKQCDDDVASIIGINCPRCLLLFLTVPSHPFGPGVIIQNRDTTFKSFRIHLRLRPLNLTK